MSTLKELAQQIKAEKDNKIIPNNIKKDVQIFDILGALEGGGGGSGDVKLFDTIANMQADLDPNEGDMAMVYRSSIQNWTEETVSNRIHFPDTVTLPEPITQEYFYGGLDSNMEGGGETYASIQINGMKEENIFNIDIMIYVSGMTESSIKYTSEDNQHFTKTQGDSDIELPIDVSHNKEMRRRL